jgi:hypothetical protein
MSVKGQNYELRFEGMQRSNSGSSFPGSRSQKAKQQASRALVIVVTDGAAQDINTLREQLKRCNDAGGYVLGVMAGQQANWLTCARSPAGHSYAQAQAGRMTQGFNECAAVPDLDGLPAALEPKLQDFLARA